MIKDIAKRFNMDESLVKTVINDIILDKKIAEIKAMFESKPIDELEAMLNVPKMITQFANDEEIIIERTPSKHKNKANINKTVQK